MYDTPADLSVVSMKGQWQGKTPKCKETLVQMQYLVFPQNSDGPVASSLAESRCREGEGLHQVKRRARLRCLTLDIWHVQIRLQMSLKV